MLTIEKNRRIPGSRKEAQPPPLAVLFWELAGTTSGTILGTARCPVSQRLSYSFPAR
jgi:hypothetical protein